MSAKKSLQKLKNNINGEVNIQVLRATIAITTAIMSIPTGAESLMLISSSIPTNRNCTIETTNYCSSHVLVNPKVHMHSGYNLSPLEPTVGPSKRDVSTFTKTAGTARGAVGVFTYELFNPSNNNDTEIIAVMFSVPFDYNLYSNWFAVGIFNNCKLCDQTLYHEMYNSVERKFVRGEGDGSSITYKGDHVTIKASMSCGSSAVMKVEVCDS
ncbi:DELTA-sagatoxin-Srs1a-like [Oncorhynchus masou masou]|uniref:DELTA-sagatoxin-Srs1a-like n=1 Tax=Oncorhynchus masou masou TaxID=90313 RepID=UPI00318343F8